MAYQTKRSRDTRVRLKSLEQGDEFAKLTFLALREDDSCWNRFLRYFWFKKPQNMVEIGEINDRRIIKDYTDWLLENEYDFQIHSENKDHFINKYMSKR